MNLIYAVSRRQINKDIKQPPKHPFGWETITFLIISFSF
jgi:hypothetical protein